MVAGLAIFPAVFALGGDPAAGPRLAFITFPQILLEMPGGQIIGPVFFFLLSAAALTSMISLLEAAAAVIRHRFRLSRPKAAAIMTGIIFALGIPSAMSYGLLANVRIAGLPLLDAVDTAASNFGLPFCGLLVALFVGWRLDRMRAALAADLGGSAMGMVWIGLLRLPVPAAILLIFANALGLI
jgi:NSS family neurotransmitter:Na+ symporter